MDITITINGITITATGNPDDMAAYTRNITIDMTTFDDTPENDSIQLGQPYWRALEDDTQITIHRHRCPNSCTGTYERSGSAQHPTAQDYFDWIQSRTATPVYIAACAL